MLINKGNGRVCDQSPKGNDLLVRALSDLKIEVTKIFDHFRRDFDQSDSVYLQTCAEWFVQVSLVFSEKSSIFVN